MEGLLKGLEESIEQAQSLCAGIKKTATYASELVKETKARIEEVSKKEEAAIKEDEDLTSRKKEIEKVENVVKLSEESRARLKEAETLFAKLEEAKGAFEKSKATLLKDVASQKAEIVESNKSLTREWAAYNKREVELKAREENYKIRIAENLVRNVK